MRRKEGRGEGGGEERRGTGRGEGGALGGGLPPPPHDFLASISVHFGNS